LDLSVIVLSYNTKELLRGCLRSVFASKLNSYKIQVIVVDNASSDGSQPMVKSNFPKVKLIENPQNYGFTKGNNIGIANSEGKYLLLLNSDTVVFPDTFKTMLDFMESNLKVGVATCKVEFPDKTLDPACHRGFPTPWNAFTYFSGLEKLFPKIRLFGGYHLGWKDLDKIHEIDTPTGAFYLVGKKVIEEVGVLDEKYFMYAEDIDLSYRIKAAGWKIMFVPKTKIVHFKKQSGREKKEKGKITKEAKAIRVRAIRCFFETMKIFYDKHYKDNYPFLVRFLVILGIWCLTQFRLLQNRLR
jgi:GT2 family glycosyltransferase